MKDFLAKAIDKGNELLHKTQEIGGELGRDIKEKSGDLIQKAQEQMTSSTKFHTIFIDLSNIAPHDQPTVISAALNDVAAQYSKVEVISVLDKPTQYMGHGLMVILMVTE